MANFSSSKVTLQINCTALGQIFPSSTESLNILILRSIKFHSVSFSVKMETLDILETARIGKCLGWGGDLEETVRERPIVRPGGQKDSQLQRREG